ncbi:hypothetical protein J502_1656 [Acinetobacter sp. 1294596]|nr:hypothetical protein J502_1656 [Acinetobacter sp. 1294596]
MDAEVWKLSDDQCGAEYDKSASHILFSCLYTTNTLFLIKHIR